MLRPESELTESQIRLQQSIYDTPRILPEISKVRTMNKIDTNITPDAIVTLGETILGPLQVSEKDIRDFMQRMTRSFPSLSETAAHECFDRLVKKLVYCGGNVSFRQSGCEDPIKWLHGDIHREFEHDLFRLKIATTDAEMSITLDKEDVDRVMLSIQHISNYMKFRENRVAE